MATPEYDVFISHAEEDRLGFVEVLAQRLHGAGIRVWYDEFAVSWGDSRSASIARGLASSRYGIVVLSRSYLWTPRARHELAGLWQNELRRGTTILPILHDISVDEVSDVEPSLADKCALDTSRNDLDQIVSTTLRFLKGGTTAPPRPADVLDVRSLAQLGRLPHADVLTRLTRYAGAARVSAGSGDVVLGLGLIHLHLRRFGEAVEALASAVRLLPGSGPAHLYHAIAMLRARKPKTLSLTEARQILQLLETAVSLDPREGLCEVLAILIKQEYFQMNGLRVPDPGIDHHVRVLGRKRIDRAELVACRDVLHGSTLLDALLR